MALCLMPEERKKNQLAEIIHKVFIVTHSPLITCLFKFIKDHLKELNVFYRAQVQACPKPGLQAGPMTSRITSKNL